MKFDYPKSEKLKSRKSLETLFKNGESVAKYPIRLVYAFESGREGSQIQMGVSVSKKYFKKASDRNYIKRCLREAYRHHKEILLSARTEPLSAMLMYQSKDPADFHAIVVKTIEIFEKFARKHGQPDASASE